MPDTLPPIALQFEQYGFHYRSQSEPTLHDIRLTVRRGEKVLVVGPSGSGKSTLAHSINGLVPHAFRGACTGTYTLCGENARNLGIFDISKRVGTVLQDPDAQFVGLSAGEDIAFVLENDCVDQPEMKQRVADAAALVDIGGHLHKSPQDLSGGQKQRVSMAGVLIDDVDILLFDEPLANLDPASGRKAIELIDQLHRTTGKAVVIIEHRLEDVLHRPVDRIVLMKNGRITADLPPADMLASGLLGRAGIREPLYLAALRYAGVPITQALHPEHVDALALDQAAPPALASHPEPAGLQSPDLDATPASTPSQALRDWDARVPEETPEPAPQPLLQVDGLRFHYPEDETRKSVLEDVSFTLHRGECVSLVGRNGAGKSTLAKLICGFEQPVAGRLSYDGSDLAEASIKQRAERIGYVMQNPNQMISFPMIFDEVALGLRSRKVPEPEVKVRVEETLKVCGLHPFRNWPVSALSFGQKKRLTIAAILVLRPQLLILDEPTAGQDFRHYTEIMEFLRDLNRETGLSLLMITHDMHLMLEYTTRALVVSDGRLLADDTPANVLTDDRLIESANLKRTSLYDLAVRAGLPQPRAFVSHFIRHDRAVRSAVHAAKASAHAGGAAPDASTKDMGPHADHADSGTTGTEVRP